jgi:hypothetical protein
MSFDPNDFAGETREDYHADLARIASAEAEREALSAEPASIVIEALEGFTRGYAIAYRLPEEAA